MFFFRKKRTEKSPVPTRADLEDAIRDWDKAIKLDPKNDKFFVMRGKAKHRLGRHEEAIDDFTRAIELNPKNDEAFGARGIAKSV